MTKAITSCLAILVLSFVAAEAFSSSVPSMPPMGVASNPPRAIPGGRKLMGGAEMLPPGCVPKALCSKNELLCFRVCPAAVEQHHEECPFKCIKCPPTCQD